MSNIIEKAWQKHLAQMAAGVTERQIFSAKIIFFAGADSVFTLLMSDKLTDDEYLKVCEDIHAELREFFSSAMTVVKADLEKGGHA